MIGRDLMRNFWAYISNGEYSVGTTGQTVYLYDKNGDEIKKFKDITYAYDPMFSPDGKLLAVKSTEGRLAVYSLETLSLIRKFRFAKVDGGQDAGFCFSPDSKRFFNIEDHDVGNSAISAYDTQDFAKISQFQPHADVRFSDIEFDNEIGICYVLGLVCEDEENFYFVSRYACDSLKETVQISELEYDFYEKYLHLKRSGFAQKAYDWTDIDCDLEKLKAMTHSLAKLHSYRTKNPLQTKEFSSANWRRFFP